MLRSVLRALPLRDGSAGSRFSTGHVSLIDNCFRSVQKVQGHRQRDREQRQGQRLCDRHRKGTPSCWAEAHIKIARMTLTIKLDRNWSSFQLANSAPPLSVTDSAIAPSARMGLFSQSARWQSPWHHKMYSGGGVARHGGWGKGCHCTDPLPPLPLLSQLHRARVLWPPVLSDYS